MSLSSLPDKLQAGELLWLSNLGILELIAGSFHVALPSLCFPKSRRAGLCCGELGGELVLRLNLLDDTGKTEEDDDTDEPNLGMSVADITAVILLLSCV